MSKQENSKNAQPDAEPVIGTTTWFEDGKLMTKQFTASDVYAAPPAAPAEPCYCDRMGIGVPGVSCGDCPRDYKPAAPDHFRDVAEMVSPDGWVMVPRDPTPEMIAAGEAAFRSYCLQHVNGAIPTYEAMIAAAPAPVVPEGDVVVSKDEQGQIVAVTRQDKEGRILSVIAESAAPVVREPLTREQQIAIREAHCNTASDEYFGARPQVDDATKRRVYEAGFKEGWESGITSQGGGK